MAGWHLDGPVIRLTQAAVTCKLPVHCILAMAWNRRHVTQPALQRTFSTWRQTQQQCIMLRNEHLLADIDALEYFHETVNMLGMLDN